MAIAAISAITLLPLIILVNTLLLFMTYSILYTKRFVSSLSPTQLNLIDEKVDMKIIIEDLSQDPVVIEGPLQNLLDSQHHHD